MNRGVAYAGALIASPFLWCQSLESSLQFSNQAPSHPEVLCTPTGILQSRMSLTRTTSPDELVNLWEACHAPMPLQSELVILRKPVSWTNCLFDNHSSNIPPYEFTKAHSSKDLNSSPSIYRSCLTDTVRWIVSDLRISIFVPRHRYWQCHIPMLSKPINAQV